MISVKVPKNLTRMMKYIAVEELTRKIVAMDTEWLMLLANLTAAYNPHNPQDSLTVGEQIFPHRGRTRFTQ